MKNIFSILKKDTGFSISAVSDVIKSFSFKERLVFFSVLWIFIFSFLISVEQINKKFMVEIPDYGGSISEGIVGVPRYINPLLAISDADRDLSTLVYSGLMRVGKNGKLIPDLAEGYSVSEDGLSYSFTLKENIYFHDGEEINADDVLFTITKVQDPALKSPRRANWDGVLVEKINDREITFTLPKPYAPFLENTTLGILPKHLWKDASSEQFNFSEFNTNPIGSGPYKVADIKRNSSGIPLYYDLVPFKKFALGKAYIKKIRLMFYPNEKELLQGLKRGEIIAVNAIQPGIAEDLKKENYFIRRTPLPRVFGLFFNQNQAPVFSDIAVRKALKYATDKERIVSEVLRGYATIIDSPIPPGSLAYDKIEEKGEKQKNTDTDTTGETKSALERAEEILSKNGWKANDEDGVLEKKINGEMTRLEFSISTSDVTELKEVAKRIKEDWEKLGAKVTIKIFESNDLNQNVIRPRKYDVLLFGEVVGRNSDLFAFWHSSQRNDPGLNIALYANISVDKLLDSARTILNSDERREKYMEFKKEIANDVPAVFLYSPNFIYILPKNIRGVSFSSATVPSERFLNIHKWYIETQSVWQFFSK